MEVLLCNKNEYVYFEEYIKSILGNKHLVLYDTTSIFTEDWIYWCIRRVPFTQLPQNAKIKFINTEQLTVPEKLFEYNFYAIEGVEVYDYSFENISISGKGTYLPYTEIPEETIKLKEYLKQPKLYDFAIIGSPSEHRSNVIKNVKSKGYTVFHVHGWGDTRDIQVGKCRYLLNLHYNYNYQIYESIRCERWRFAGMPIYSEKCIVDLPDGVKTIDPYLPKV
jgi:hypothetical protein